MQTALQLSVKPLRAENSTRWIPGLNPDIAKLFDWLDDITQLHCRLLSTMQGCRVNQVMCGTALFSEHLSTCFKFPIVTQIAESLRPFVSELEIYQPYIVRVDECIDWVQGVALDPDSDFGEFIRIQSTAPECTTSLPVLLQKPIQRLLRYSVHFKVSPHTR